jgi:hypothetical protein
MPIVKALAIDIVDKRLGWRVLCKDQRMGIEPNMIVDEIIRRIAFTRYRGTVYQS